MSTQSARMPAIDIARGLAVCGMVIFHACWNLTHFGYLPPGAMAGFAGVWSARLIAGTFLFLAGVSLALAHGRGFRPAAFWRRFAIIAAGAAAVSAVSIFAMPGLPIYFGILHCIAASSLIALLVLRWPPLLVLAIGLAVLVFPLTGLSFGSLSTIWLWTGLGGKLPVMADYVPLIPFTGVLLAGVAAGGLIAARMPKERQDATAREPEPAMLRRFLTVLGRHSLLIYLLHQPLLYGLTSAAAQFLPPAQGFDALSFTAACISECSIAGGSADHCRNICECTARSITLDPRLMELSRQPDSPEWTALIQQVARACVSHRQ